MSLRLSVQADHVNAVQDVVDTYLKRILTNTKRVGAYTDPDWQAFLTEARLKQHIDGDVIIAEKANLVNFSNLNITSRLTGVIQQVFPNKRIEPSGCFHYPTTGYMGWHTNSDVSCRRLYITWAAEANKSFFRYYQDNKVITDYDDKGLTFRLFDITNKPPYLWHCVGSQTDRISIGYRVFDTYDDR